MIACSMEEQVHLVALRRDMGNICKVRVRRVQQLPPAHSASLGYHTALLKDPVPASQ
jgi:hypothetical protein